MSNLIKKVVTGVSSVALAASMLISPMAINSVHAAMAGEVYKTTDGTVWFITSDMNRRPFTSAGAFLSYGFLSFSQVKEADSMVTALPTGAFIAPQDGRIFCATETKASDVKGECSLVTGGQKAAFTSASVFGGQGYSFSRAYYGDSSFLMKTSNVDNASAQHRPGTLINNAGTVQLVVTGGLWGVPSMDVFNSWGWSFADVVPSNSADVLLSQIGVIPARMAGNLVPTATTGGTGTGGTLNGGAGDISVTATTADNETTVNEGANNTYVNAFKAEATGSDVSLTSVKVTMTQTGGSGTNGSTKLDKYADNVAIYMGSTKVGSLDVSEFTKSGTTYTGTIALTNAIVREGSANKQTFHVAVSALSNLDSADLSAVHNVWNVGASQIRFIDGTGVTLTSGTGSTATNFSFDSLASSGDVKLKVATATDNPMAQNVEVSDTGTTSDVALLKFKLSAEGSDVSFDQIKFDLTKTGLTNLTQMVSEFALKRGTTTIQTVTPASGDTQVIFNLDTDEMIDADSSATYSVVAKISQVCITSTCTGTPGSWFTQGDSLKVSFNDVNGLDMNSDAIVEQGSATGEVQTFFSEGISVSNFTYTVTPTSDTSGNILKETYNISYKVTAFGNTYYVPKTVVRSATASPSIASDQGLVYTIENSSGTTQTLVPVGSANGGLTSPDATVTNSTWYQVPDGATRTFNVTIEVDRGSTPVAGFYHVQLNVAGYDIDAITGGTLGYTFSPANIYETTDSKID